MAIDLMLNLTLRVTTVYPMCIRVQRNVQLGLVCINNHCKAWDVLAQFDESIDRDTCDWNISNVVR